MVSLKRQKFYDAIYSFLLESLSPEKSANQAEIYVENMIDILKDIELLMEENNVKILPQKFHLLKNILLNGDFYYESDLCEDIEQGLRKNKKVDNVKSLYNDLLESLKSDD